MVFAFIPTLKTNLYWFLHPDTRICRQKAFCTVTIIWLRSTLCRDTAPVPDFSIYAPWLIPSSNQPCTAIHVKLKKPCTRLAKTHAILVLHRDNFSAPLPRGTRTLLGAAPSNTTSLYCRAVMWHSKSKKQAINYLDNLSWHVIPAYLSGLRHL
jgi:hypothetical protein